MTELGRGGILPTLAAPGSGDVQTSRSHLGSCDLETGSHMLRMEEQKEGGLGPQRDHNTTTPILECLPLEFFNVRKINFYLH